MTALSALILLIPYLTLKPSSATDTLTATEFLKDAETIVSESSTFALGFFSPPNSTHRYVGIWYSKPSVKDIVWVANKNSPLNDSSGIFRVSKDGNLQVLNGKNQILWSSNVSNVDIGGNFSAAAQILDSGNLVLRIKDDVIWQSFDHPADSFLPNMRLSTTKNLNEKKTLRSWKSLSDPSDGRFTLGMDGFVLPQLLIREGDRPHWRSGPWNGNYLIGVQFNFIDFINAQMLVSSDKEESVSATYFYPNKSLLSTYMLTTEGKMTQIWWDDVKRSWEVEWQAPATECDVYGKCGAFGTCKPQRRTICQCLKGFEPRNKAEWSKGNWTSGCMRMKRLKCESGDGKDDGFLRLKMMKVPDHGEWRLGLTQDGCGTQCLNNCSCLAYAYDIGVGCMTWSTSLVDIQEFSVSGMDLYLRLAHSEIGKKFT